MTGQSTGKTILNLPSLPAPSERRLALRVRPAAERALRGGHPWLYADAIRQQSHEGQPGDLGVVFDRQRRFVAIGLYDPLSPLRLRVLQQGRPAPIDRNWFAARLAAALALREPLAQDERTTGYRLVHGENDSLPGLVVDRYDQTVVLKLYTAAWVPHLPALLDALLDRLPVQRLVLRLSRDVAAQPAFLYGLQPGQVLAGPPLEGPVTFQENGLRFSADVVAGQKTGFFFDHRDNRRRVERLAAGKRVLNVFAYTGAFSLYAARGGAPGPRIGPTRAAARSATIWRVSPPIWTFPTRRSPPSGRSSTTGGARPLPTPPTTPRPVFSNRCASASSTRGTVSRASSPSSPTSRALWPRRGRCSKRSPRCA